MNAFASVPPPGFTVVIILSIAWAAPLYIGTFKQLYLLQGLALPMPCLMSPPDHELNPEPPAVAQ